MRKPRTAGSAAHVQFGEVWRHRLALLRVRSREEGRTRRAISSRAAACELSLCLSFSAQAKLRCSSASGAHDSRCVGLHTTLTKYHTSLLFHITNTQHQQQEASARRGKVSCRAPLWCLDEAAVPLPLSQSHFMFHFSSLGFHFIGSPAPCFVKADGHRSRYRLPKGQAAVSKWRLKH